MIGLDTIYIAQLFTFSLLQTEDVFHCLKMVIANEVIRLAICTLISSS